MNQLELGSIDSSPTKSTKLSELVDQEFYALFPRFRPQARPNILATWFRVHFRQPYLWVFPAFLMFVIANEVFAVLGVSVGEYQIISQATSAILDTFVTSTAAVIGIAIPLIILVIEFLGRDSSTIIDIYLDKTEIRQTTIFAVSILGLQIFANLYLEIQLGTSLQAQFYGLAFFLIANIAVLASVVRSLNLVRRSISDEFRIAALREKILEGVEAGMRVEAKQRIGRIILKRITESLGAARDWGNLVPQNRVVPFATSKRGLIVDIDLSKWLSIFQEPGPGKSRFYITHGTLFKTIGETIQPGEKLAYLVGDNSHSVEEIQEELDRCLIVDEKLEPRPAVDHRLFRQLKRLTEVSIQEGNYELFVDLLNIYIQIFEFGLELPPPPPETELAFFSGWSVSLTEADHLWGFVTLAAQNNNDRFIDRIAYVLAVVLSLIIEKSESHLSELPNWILDLFVGIYTESFNYKNQTGILKSFDSLTRGQITHRWEGKYERTQNDEEAIANLGKIQGAIFRYLTRILAAMISNKDYENLKTLIGRLAPAEFIPDMNFRDPRHDMEIFDLQQQLRQKLQGGEADKIKARLRVLEFPRKLGASLTEQFYELLVVAMGYVFEGYLRDEFDLADSRELLEIFRPHLPNFDAIQEAFLRLIDLRSFNWAQFDRNPDTRRGYTPNTEAKYFLFYCLYGMKMLADEKANSQPRDLRSELQRIKNTLDEIIKETDKWSGVFESDENLDDLAKRFYEQQQALQKQWNLDRKRAIESAPLDKGRVNAFLKAYEEGFADREASLSLYLDGLGKVTQEPLLARWTTLIDSAGLGSKDYFTAHYPDESNVVIAGKSLARHILNREDDYLISRWLRGARSVRSRKEWDSLAEYIEAALSKLGGSEDKDLLIFVPQNTNFHFVARAPDFLPASEAPSSLPGYWGLYKNIPVLRVMHALEQNILLVNATAEYLIEIDRSSIKLVDDPEKGILALINERIRMKIFDNSEILRLRLKNPNTALFVFPADDAEPEVV